jgi:hypothetical protein
MFYDANPNTNPFDSYRRFENLSTDQNRSTVLEENILCFRDMRRHLVYTSIDHYCYVTVSQTDLDPDPLRSPQHDVGRQWRFIFVGLCDVCAYTREITLASQRESYTNNTRWSRPGKRTLKCCV